MTSRPAASRTLKTIFVHQHKLISWKSCFLTIVGAKIGYRINSNKKFVLQAKPPFIKIILIHLFERSQKLVK